jgi:hypothetical protein
MADFNNHVLVTLIMRRRTFISTLGVGAATAIAGCGVEDGDGTGSPDGTASETASGNTPTGSGTRLVRAGAALLRSRRRRPPRRRVERSRSPTTRTRSVS